MHCHLLCIPLADPPCVAVLNPRYKTQYFYLKNWPAAWIEEALDVIKAEWTANYKGRGSHADNANTGAPPNGSRTHPGHHSAQRSVRVALSAL